MSTNDYRKASHENNISGFPNNIHHLITSIRNLQSIALRISDDISLLKELHTILLDIHGILTSTNLTTVQEPDLVTVEQAAHKLSCNARTITRRVKENKLEAVQDGGLYRIKSSSIRAYIVRYTVMKEDCNDY